MGWQRAVAMAAVTAFASIASAATVTMVVDVPSRGTTVRILHAKPDAPIATLIAIPGGNGAFDIRSDGTATSRTAYCSPIARNLDSFVARGYAVVLVDPAADGSIYDPRDIAAVAAYARAQASVPLWFAGGSNSTQAIWDTAVGLTPAIPAGIVFFSPQAIGAAHADLYTRPTLIIMHRQDTSVDPRPLAEGLAAVPVVQVVSLGGGGFGGCGYHLFQGLDGPFMDAVTTFIATYNATLRASTSVPAVEFYNAALDHYFLTHRPDEIATLDAGVAIKGWARTGQGFNVLAGEEAGSSPVCRFYIPPGKGDSHFYGRGVGECTATALANPTFVNEDPQFFHMVLPVAGTCPPQTMPVYRVFSNRPDANHRYLVDRALRDTMTARGWLPEGDGPDLVVMCSPS